MNRFHQTIAAPARRDDPNYPGVPVNEPGDLTAKTTSRATVDYDTYVLRYAARQRGHVLLATAGVVMALGAAIYLSGPALVILIAGGVGLLMAGGVGFAVTADAHGSYTRDLAVSISETYHTRPQPPPATIRPFVASANSDGRTTNTGRLSFEPRIWQALFDLALGNAGTIDRDNVAKRAGVGRRWYHTDPNSADGYRAFLDELRQIGFIDDRNRLTDVALSWYDQQIALPLTAIPVRPRNDRPTGDRPATDRPQSSGWGGLE